MNDFANSFEKYDFPNFGWTRLPKPPITEDDKIKVGLSREDSNDKLIYTLCQIGFRKKVKLGLIDVNKKQEYIDRCELELDTFKELNFTDYILLVWKMVEKAREIGVFIDYGRGSVVSSCAAWFLGLTGCDPIKYKLFFSRFVSKARAKSKIIDGEVWISNELAPDIDQNFGEGRDTIIQWLKELYPNRICKIANISSLTGKILVKDVYKTVEECNENEAKSVSELIERRFGVVQDIEDVYKDNKDFKNWADSHNLVYNICLNLRDVVRQYSSHASGYLVSYEELTEHTPLMLDSEKNIISAYTMDSVQCLKLDLLGLETNLVIKNILKNIPEDINDINLDNNPIIYDQFQHNSLLPYGLYQISASCAFRVCNNLKPKNILELSHVNAIARPTALAYEEPYINNTTKCPHPLFKDALEWTRWLPLYQEQTSALVKAIGFDDDTAEQFRRVFAKKKLDELDKWVIKIQNKLEEKNLPKEAGDILVKLAKESANYQFNLSHSLATSYLSALTVYLKYKYPLQFYVAWLNVVKDSGNAKFSPLEKIAQIESELNNFGIKLLPPDITKSCLDFTIEDKNIRFGIGSIKGVAEKVKEHINEFKKVYTNKFEMFQGAHDSSINIGVFCSLIQSGCLDSFLYRKTRSKLVLEAQTWNILTDKEKIFCNERAIEYNYDLLNIIKDLTEKYKNEKGVFLIKPSRFETIKKKYEPYKEIYLKNSKNQELANYWYESRVLGFSYSSTLKNIYIKSLPKIISINEIKDLFSDMQVEFVGIVKECKSGVANNEKKTKYFKCLISDEKAQVSVMLFCYKNKEGKITDRIQDCIDYNNGKLPEEGQVVIVKGKKKGDSVFAESISIQDKYIITTLGELNKFNKDKEIIEKTAKQVEMF